MHHKLLNYEAEPVHALILDKDDEVIDQLQRFCEEHEITAARFSAIGAFRSAVLGYFNWDSKQYDRIPVDEQVEVLSLLGDVALCDEKPKIHAHVVLGRRDGNTCGGHLLEAQVRPTLEVILTESPAYLRRTSDPESGLALIHIDR